MQRVANSTEDGAVRVRRVGVRRISLVANTTHKHYAEEFGREVSRRRSQFAASPAQSQGPIKSAGDKEKENNESDEGIEQAKETTCAN